MKYTLSDKLIAYLTLISGLIISAVAVWYSVAGLVSIFAASATSIIIMGVALEGSKLVATLWLKWNWHRAPRLIKAYLISAISVLMLITSMGIFGYLSKAHLDQSLVSGEVQSKIAIYDEKIKTAKENIEASRKALRQMDEAVDQTMARSTSEEGATKASNLRRSQQRERSALTREIETNQKLIATLNEESAPIRAEVRKVEAEVGPIKYIAALIYGDNPDANLLEKAVTWVIIIIVLVFDPLAVVLLLASQYSFQWFRQQEQLAEGDSPLESVSVVDDQPLTVTNSGPWPFMVKVPEEKKDDISLEKTSTDADATVGTDLPESGSTGNDQELHRVEHTEVQPVESGQPEIIEEPKKKELEYSEESNRLTEQELNELDNDPDWSDAKRAWKEANPDSSIKEQKRFYLEGTIDRLPWESFINKKHYIVKENAVQVKKEVDISNDAATGEEVRYIQNEEQSEESLWNRIKNRK